MKTSTVLFLSLLFLSTMASAQSVNWQWARTSSGPNLAEGGPVALDTAGNVYAVGGYYDSISFEGQTIYTMLGPAMSHREGSYVIAKYTLSGTLLSLQTPSLPISLWYIAIDDHDNMYSAGQMVTDTVRFRAVAYISKFDAAGQVLWSDTPSSPNPAFGSQAYNMALDPSGYPYTVGVYFDSMISFGSHSLHSISRNGTFMVRYNAAGSPLWARSIQTDTGTSGNVDCVAPDRSGHVFFGGVYLGSDSVVIGGTTIHARQAGALNGFITQYDSAGHMIWAKSAVSPAGNLTVQRLCTDQDGNVYIAGTYDGDSIVIGNMSIPTTGGGGALFLAKINGSGVTQWIKAAGSANNSGSPSAAIAVSNQGQLFVSFGASNAVVWDGVTLTTNHGYPQDWSYLLTLDLNGHLLCSQMLSAGGDDGAALIAGKDGAAYFVGDYMDSTFILGTDTLAPKPFGYENIFVTKFICPNFPEGIASLSTNSSLSIYPNPMSGNATATFTLPDGAANVQLMISDILGRERQTYPIGASDKEVLIHAGGLSSGVYFCSLIADGQVMATKKMVAE